MEKQRCKWASNTNTLMQDYHDQQWGVRVHEDAMLFEMLILESFQAGLSWMIVLKKREAFREAFDQFDYHKIVRYDESKIEKLMHNEGIVRNRLKIKATISNAHTFMEIQKEFGSFSNYLWAYTNDQTIINKENYIPTSNALSDKIAKDLKKRGMKFFGTVIVYSYLQAVGVINDHEEHCFLYPKELSHESV